MFKRNLPVWTGKYLCAIGHARLMSSQPKLRAHNVLSLKHVGVFAMPEHITVAEAISNMVVHSITSALAVNTQNEVEGIFTSRDLLRYLHYGHGKGRGVDRTSLSRNNLDKMKEILTKPISELVTKKEKMVYCSLTDTTSRIREMMFQLKIRNIPVVDKGAVVGIINIKDLADSTFNLQDSGGKKGFMKNITGRMGLPPHTTVKNYMDTDNGFVLLSNTMMDSHMGKMNPDTKNTWTIASNLGSAAGPTSTHPTGSTVLSDQLIRPVSVPMGDTSNDPIVQLMQEEEREEAKYMEFWTTIAKAKAPRHRVEMASYALPHPYKDKEIGVAENRKDLGLEKELCTDNLLNADAHFLTVVPVGVGSSKHLSTQAYACVADGVGSWRQFGVDPRDFAHKLVAAVKKTIEAHAVEHVESHEDSVEGNEEIDNLTDDVRATVTTPTMISCADAKQLLGKYPADTIAREAMHPLDAILEAWNATVAAHVVGSSTICVATIDTHLNQLSYSNLGDCGLMVVRHIGTGTAGFMRSTDESKKSSSSTATHRIAYLSQQQLKSFNLPYQLGYSGSVQYGGAFENPLDADTASIPVLPGDIIILATDGLFDNMDLNEIVSEVQEWEKHWFKTDEEDIRSHHSKGVDPINELAKTLVYKSREASIDTQKDSPFAVLAKENDILWSGGMPDDTTVIVMRILA